MYYAVSAKGTKEFLTPFAAARYLDKLKVAGTVAEDTPQTTIWERLDDGAWLIKRK